MGKPGFPIPLRGGGVGKPGFPTSLAEGLCSRPGHFREGLRPPAGSARAGGYWQASHSAS